VGKPRRGGGWRQATQAHARDSMGLDGTTRRGAGGGGGQYGRWWTHTPTARQHHPTHLRKLAVGVLHAVALVNDDVLPRDLPQELLVFHGVVVGGEEHVEQAPAQAHAAAVAEAEVGATTGNIGAWKGHFAGMQGVRSMCQCMTG
jgi:hypothetical protein